ncbi:hypothetical protein CAMRE0001_2619 [Campylobacter rectus RM3267]|uniref:Uncharacterized protein n=1 Tax=Campylobacter rectus RM3267 TaxID=553218 RepID=B9D446_CAMRE|nr:hypothetical protein CAMRE0001_2619 [Campylobacter rectus RM3267]
MIDFAAARSEVWRSPNFTDQNLHRKNALLGGDRIKFGINLRRGDFAARFY